MKKISLTILVFAWCAVFGAIAFGQNAPAPVNVNIPVLIDWDSVFESILAQIRPYMGEIVGLGLLFFAVTLAMAYLQGMIEGNLQRRLAEQKHRERIERRAASIEERQEVARELRQREMKRSDYVDEVERELRSQELRNIVLDEGESFANIDGTYHVRSEKHGIVEYKTLDRWRADHDAVEDEPLAFDNEDPVGGYKRGVKPAGRYAGYIPRRYYRERSYSW
jgi:hypothetical protein